MSTDSARQTLARKNYILLCVKKVALEQICIVRGHVGYRSQYTALLESCTAAVNAARNIIGVQPIAAGSDIKFQAIAELATGMIVTGRDYQVLFDYEELNLQNLSDSWMELQLEGIRGELYAFAGRTDVL